MTPHDSILPPPWMSEATWNALKVGDIVQLRKRPGDDFKVIDVSRLAAGTIDVQSCDEPSEVFGTIRHELNEGVEKP